MIFQDFLFFLVRSLLFYHQRADLANHNDPALVVSVWAGMLYIASMFQAENLLNIDDISANRAN